MAERTSRNPDDYVDVTERYPPGSLRAAEPSDQGVAATLTVLKGPRVGAVFRMREGENVIGRAAESQVQVVTEGVSRRHARVSSREDRWWVEDIGSTNGTICRGMLLDRPMELRDGDRINLGGRVILRFALEGELEEALRAQLYELATRDPLTSAYNRRYFDERMDSEWPWAIRHERACALLMVDIDHFKEVNDRWGHQAGDLVLQQVVDRIKATVRREDLLARVGGEEFAVLCRGTGLGSAVLLGERLRHSVASEPFELPGELVTITVSVGVGTSAEGGVRAPNDLLALADHRLYQAKQGGRNRVEPNPT